MDYSFNSIIERNNTILNSSTTYLSGNGGGTGGGNNGGSSFKAVRVISIILNDLHPRWDELGQWAALGAIMYDEISTSNGIGPGYLKENIFSYPVAYPVNSFIKHYPLLNEIIYLIDLPSNNLDFNPTSTKKYYIDSINLWNHPHHNGYPLPNVTLPSEVLNDYTLSTGGTIRRIVDDPNISNTEGASGINLGDTFIEKSNIHPLHPFEGDTIIEGRWGNSIRFGSTVTTFDNSTNNLNPWSEGSSNGSPIIIIRNGQGNVTQEGWKPIIEDINNDESSIYLTSNQLISQINSKFSNISNNGYYIDSYVSSSIEPPQSLQTYNNSQIILNSGRVVLNSILDNVILSSPVGDIHLSANSNINLDSNETIIDSKTIIFGNKLEFIEPLVLGFKLQELLLLLLNTMNNLNETLRTVKTEPVIEGSPASIFELNKTAEINKILLDNIANLVIKDTFLSTTVFTKP